MHKRLCNTFCADQANSGKLYVGLPCLQTLLPSEWLHLIWESGGIVHPEPVGGMEILKAWIARGNLYSHTSYWRRVGMLRQEVERGSELWGDAWWLQREGSKQRTPFNLKVEQPQLSQVEDPGRPLYSKKKLFIFLSSAFLSILVKLYWAFWVLGVSWLLYTAIHLVWETVIPYLCVFPFSRYYLKNQRTMRRHLHSFHAWFNT